MKQPQRGQDFVFLQGGLSSYKIKLITVSEYFLTNVIYILPLLYTLDLGAMFSYNCSKTLCHSLDVGKQISSDRWTVGPEGAQRMDNLVLGTTVHHVPLPAIGEKSVPDTEQTRPHPQGTVSKTVHNIHNKLCYII